MTVAAEAKWVAEDEVERLQKALQVAAARSASLNKHFDCFIKAAEEKGIDTKSYSQRRDIRCLPRPGVSYVLPLVSGGLFHV